MLPLESTKKFAPGRRDAARARQWSLRGTLPCMGLRWSRRPPYTVREHEQWITQATEEARSIFGGTANVRRPVDEEAGALGLTMRSTKPTPLAMPVRPISFWRKIEPATPTGLTVLPLE